MRRSPLTRKTPLRSRSAPKSRRKAPIPPATARRSAEHGMDYPEARRIVYGRSGGRCEAPWCGAPLGDRMEAHHRLTRRFGPDCPCNLLALCSRCHHAEVHEQPERARDHGLIVSRHTAVPPAEVPAVLHRRGPVLLDCHGKFARVA